MLPHGTKFRSGALRRVVAGSIGQSAWLVPHAPAFAEGVARVAQLVARGGGTRLSGLYMEAREAEWLEGCYRA